MLSVHIILSEAMTDIDRIVRVKQKRDTADADIFNMCMHRPTAVEAFGTIGHSCYTYWLLFVWCRALVMLVAYRFGSLSVLQPMLSLN